MAELGGRCPTCGRMRTWVFDGVTVCLFCDTERAPSTNEGSGSA